MASIDDLVALGYTAEEAFTGIDRVVVVEGYGVRTFVADTDQETIDLLAALPAHVERVFQSDYPEADEARDQLEESNFVVERPDPDVNLFNVVEGGATVATDVPPEDLPGVASDLIP